MENKLLIQFNSDVAKDSPETRIALYSNIGFFIEVAQMLEFNLRKLLCFELSVKEIQNNTLTKETVAKICEKYETYYLQTYKKRLTLGQLNKEVKKSTTIHHICDIIQEVNDYRIQVVHKIFQNNIIKGGLSKPETVRLYVEKRLIPMTDKAVEINKQIIEEITKYQAILHDYKKQVGISE